MIGHKVRWRDSDDPAGELREGMLLQFVPAEGMEIIYGIVLRRKRYESVEMESLEFVDHVGQKVTGWGDV